MNSTPNSTGCPGDELEPQDHRVLGQLSRSSRGFQKLCKRSRLTDAAQRLGMIQIEWNDRVQWLIDFGYVLREEGDLYILQKCTCPQEEGLPSIGSDGRKSFAQNGSWKRVPPARLQSSSRGPSRVPPPGGTRNPPVGGVTDRSKSTTTSNKLISNKLPGERKAFAQGRIKAISVAATPAVKPKTTSRDLRATFRQKWNEAGIVDVLHLGVTDVVGGIKSGAFTSALVKMREEFGLKPDQIEAMMDEFMQLVLGGVIKIEGKSVWKVFVARRKQLLERTVNRQGFGSGAGKTEELSAAQRHALDSLRRPR